MSQAFATACPGPESEITLGTCPDRIAVICGWRRPASRADSGQSAGRIGRGKALV